MVSWTEHLRAAVAFAFDCFFLCPVARVAHVTRASTHNQGKHPHFTYLSRWVLATLCVLWMTNAWAFNYPSADIAMAACQQRVCTCTDEGPTLGHPWVSGVN